MPQLTSLLLAPAPVALCSSSPRPTHFSHPTCKPLVLCRRVTERMGGKFVSIQMLAMVPGPDNVASVFEALGQDPRVKMKF